MHKTFAFLFLMNSTEKPLKWKKNGHTIELFKWYFPVYEARVKGPLNLDSLCHTSCVMTHFIILMNQPHKMRMRSHSFLNYICFLGHVSFFFLFLVTIQRGGIFWFDIWMGRKRFCVGRYQLRWIWTDRRIWAGFGWIEGQAAPFSYCSDTSHHHHYHQDSSSAQCSNVYPPSLILQMDYI